MAIHGATDLPPIPFDHRILASALKLKEMGLKWQPKVGCFVWDHKGMIGAPSPFPLKVYFVLNVKRFERNFGSFEKIQEYLVWIPTWHQALLLCDQRGNAIKRLNLREIEGPSATDALLGIYKHLMDAFRKESVSSAEVET